MLRVNLYSSLQMSALPELIIGKTGEISWKLIPLHSIEAHREILTNDLTPIEKKEMEVHSLQKRQMEYLAIRSLKNIDFPSVSIAYKPSGKPLFHGIKTEIGISHSRSFALWATASFPFGCDVEEIDERLVRVSQRFCSHEELMVIEENVSTKSLTKLWSCKEAIYKLCDDPGIHWKTDMVCIGVDQEQWIFSVRSFGKTKKVVCAVIPIENAILAFAYDA